MTADMYYTLGIGALWVICGFFSTLFLGLIVVATEKKREVYIEGYPLFMALLWGFVFGPYSIPVAIAGVGFLLLMFMVISGVERLCHGIGIAKFFSKLNPFPICIATNKKCNCE